MRHARKIVNLLALAGVLSVVAWGCSTDSPTAPRQQVPPPTTGPGQSYFISVSADPGGIVIGEMPTGDESTTLLIEVHVGSSNGPRPADGTTVQVDTNLGSFDPVELVDSGGVELVSGRAFLTLFAGGTPVQLGVATVRARLQNTVGRRDVPISFLQAGFFFTNPENNLSVDFFDNSLGSPTSFFWNFGDGHTSTKQNPVHLYDNAGTYTVSLTVSKQIGGVTLTDKTEDAADGQQMVTVGVEPVPPAG